MPFLHQLAKMGWCIKLWVFHRRPKVHTPYYQLITPILNEGWLLPFCLSSSFSFFFFFLFAFISYTEYTTKGQPGLGCLFDLHLGTNFRNGFIDLYFPLIHSHSLLYFLDERT